MNREDIIKLAREVEMALLLEEHAGEYGNGTLENTPYSELERFANLVAAHEREACAKVCEGNDAAWTETAWNDACHTCAAAIRARGNDA